MESNWEAGVGPSQDALLEACNAALDECLPLTDADVRMIASALKDHITGERAAANSLHAALETENSQHINLIEILNQQRDELVLALMWCSMRMKKDAYQKHVEWVISKYPKPIVVAEPRIVRSETQATQ